MARIGTVERRFRIQAEQAERLRRLAQVRQVSEDRIVEKALDILFSLTELLDSDTERRGWSALSEDSLARIWDNDEDARYDDWAELYGAPTR
jgi:hypothetical protein